VVLQPDEKIDVAGVAPVNGITQFIVLHYKSDGILDPSFGSNAPGYSLTNIAVNSTGYAIGQQSNGKVVVGGYDQTDTKFAVAQYANPFTLASFTTSYGEVGLL